jgi:multicomponent Na+:H+ antiporter subunit G
MITETIVLICLVIGILFNALGVLGLLRFPDVYTRMHATTKATTFGSVFTALAVIIYGGSAYYGTADPQYITLIIHTMIAAVALAFTNAVSSHALARAAHKSGIKPAPAVVDRLGEVRR